MRLPLKTLFPLAVAVALAVVASAPCPAQDPSLLPPGIDFTQVQLIGEEDTLANYRRHLNQLRTDLLPTIEYLRLLPDNTGELTFEDSTGDLELPRSAELRGITARLFRVRGRYVELPSRMKSEFMCDRVDHLESRETPAELGPRIVPTTPASHHASFEGGLEDGASEPITYCRGLTGWIVSAGGPGIGLLVGIDQLLSDAGGMFFGVSRPPILNFPISATVEERGATKQYTFEYRSAFPGQAGQSQSLYKQTIILSRVDGVWLPESFTSESSSVTNPTAEARIRVPLNREVVRFAYTTTSFPGFTRRHLKGVSYLQEFFEATRKTPESEPEFVVNPHLTRRQEIRFSKIEVYRPAPNNTFHFN